MLSYHFTCTHSHMCVLSSAQNETKKRRCSNRFVFILFNERGRNDSNWIRFLCCRYFYIVFISDPCRMAWWYDMCLNFWLSAIQCGIFEKFQVLTCVLILDQGQECPNWNEARARTFTNYLRVRIVNMQATFKCNKNSPIKETFDLYLAQVHMIEIGWLWKLVDLRYG